MLGAFDFFTALRYSLFMVVRMRHTRSHTANRRSHHALISPRMSKCECGAMRSPHRACAVCGKYNGKVVVDMVAKAARKAKKIQEAKKENNLKQ